MRIPFCPDFPLFGTDIECIVDIEVEWDLGTPHLVINDVLDSTGKVSLMHNEDKLMEDFGFRIADMAEDCPKLLEKAVEQDCFEAEAA